MSERGIMFTDLVWENDQGEEISIRARVIYTFSPGYRGSSIEPPEPASVEIANIVSEPAGVVIPDQLWEDEGLLAECMADQRAHQEEAREWRAQCRRDAVMERDHG